MTIKYPDEHGFDDDDELPELEDIPRVKLEFEDAVLQIYNKIESKAEKEDAAENLAEAAVNLFNPQVPIVYRQIRPNRSVFDRIKESCVRAFDSIFGRNKQRTDFLVGEYTGRDDAVTPEEAVMLSIAGMGGVGCGIIINKVIMTVVPILAACVVVYYISKTYNKLPDWDEEQMNKAIMFMVDMIGEVRTDCIPFNLTDT